MIEHAYTVEIDDDDCFHAVCRCGFISAPVDVRRYADADGAHHIQRRGTLDRRDITTVTEQLTVVASSGSMPPALRNLAADAAAIIAQLKPYEPRRRPVKRAPA